MGAGTDADGGVGDRVMVAGTDGDGSADGGVKSCL